MLGPERHTRRWFGASCQATESQYGNPGRRRRTPMRQLTTKGLSTHLLCIAALAAAVIVAPVQAQNGFNQPGNYLIADQFNNRVIEVDPNGNVVWQFGRGPTDFSPHSIIGVNDAQRV